MTPVLRDAALLWAYLGRGRDRKPSDLVVVCGSYDERVCDHGIGLVLGGLAPGLLLTGGSGNWTRHLWDRAEAEIFADRARAAGIAPARLWIEPRASNFSENVTFTRELRPDLRSATFVTKPNSIARLRLTLAVRWPELDAAIDAPDLAFPDDVSNRIGQLGVIDEMVGDIDRIIAYPAWGFQAYEEVPDEVLRAWTALVAQGFDRHLVDASRPVP